MRPELKQIPLNQHSPLNYVDLGSIGCRGRPWWLLLSDQIKKLPGLCSHIEERSEM